MIGKCNEFEAAKIYLLKLVKILDDRAEAICFELNKALNHIFGEEHNKENFIYLVTDQAASCMAAGRELKRVYTKLKHVSCLCHCFHNVCNEIRKKCSLVDKIICQIKKWLQYSSETKKKYNEIFPKSEKLPILIRWGTWLSYALFIYRNFDHFIIFIEFCERKTTRNILSIFQSVEFENEIRYINKFAI